MEASAPVRRGPEPGQDPTPPRATELDARRYVTEALALAPEAFIDELAQLMRMMHLMPDGGVYDGVDALQSTRRSLSRSALRESQMDDDYSCSPCASPTQPRNIDFGDSDYSPSDMVMVYSPGSYIATPSSSRSTPHSASSSSTTTSTVSARAPAA